MEEPPEPCKWVLEWAPGVFLGGLGAQKWSRCRDPELKLGWDLIEQSCSETKQLGRNQQQKASEPKETSQEMDLGI